jgi:hypothetical protein
MTQSEADFINQVRVNSTPLSVWKAEPPKDPYEALPPHVRALTEAIHVHRLLPVEANKMALAQALQAFAAKMGKQA